MRPFHTIKTDVAQHGDEKVGPFLTRRNVLGAGAGLFLSAALGPIGSARARSSATPLIAYWVRVTPDSRVMLIASQSEMGQGITTTLAAALADELYLPWEHVHIEFAPFSPSYRDPVFHWMFTGNSQGISSFYGVMRKMGAAAREMLLEAAARQWHTTADALSIADKKIFDGRSTRSLTYGEVAAAAAKLAVPANPMPRPDPQYKGRSLPRWDIPSKVDGSATFGIDVKIPGMVNAALRFAPRFGATLARYDVQGIKAKPGLLDVVELPGGLAVVAQTYWQAHKALESADLRWSESGSVLSSDDGLPAVFGEKLSAGSFFTHKSVGDVTGVADERFNTVKAVYEIPFEAHATMEPMNCTASVTDDSCTLWVPTQGVELSQQVAVQVTGLPSEKITIHRTFLGGGFGRRLLADFVKQALIVAMAVKRPVKLIWSREADVTHDFYRPGMLHEISGALDRSGRVAVLAHKVVSPSYMLYIVPRGFLPKSSDWTDPIPPPQKMDAMAVEGLVDIPYDIPSQQVEQHRLELDVPVSVWRTTGHGPNNFVLESFIDELAAKAKADPLTFRRALLSSNPRALKVLDAVAEKSDWSQSLPSGRARGVALAAAFGGIIASVAELSVVHSAIKIHRIVCVVDCGTTLDPRIAESNILGGVVWGLSALRTAITFKEGRAEQSNFDSFDPFHLWETPPAEVHFVNSGAKLGGTGELGPVPVPPAICNAVFAATGKRIRSMPVTREGFTFA